LVIFWKSSHIRLWIGINFTNEEIKRERKLERMVAFVVWYRKGNGNGNSNGNGNLNSDK